MLSLFGPIYIFGHRGGTESWVRVRADKKIKFFFDFVLRIESFWARKNNKNFENYFWPIIDTPCPRLRRLFQIFQTFQIFDFFDILISSTSNFNLSQWMSGKSCLFYSFTCVLMTLFPPTLTIFFWIFWFFLIWSISNFNLSQWMSGKSCFFYTFTCVLMTLSPVTDTLIFFLIFSIFFLRIES